MYVYVSAPALAAVALVARFQLRRVCASLQRARFGCLGPWSLTMCRWLRTAGSSDKVAGLCISAGSVSCELLLSLFW